MSKEEITHIILDKRAKGEDITQEENKIALQYFTQEYIDGLYMPNYGSPKICGLRVSSDSKVPKTYRALEIRL